MKNVNSKLILTCFACMMSLMAFSQVNSTIAFYVSNLSSNGLPTNTSDSIAYEMLVNSGYQVKVIDSHVAEANEATDTVGVDLILISSSLSSGTIRFFADSPKPIIIWENGAFDEYGLAGEKGGGDNAKDILVRNEDHPLATNLGTGSVEIFFEPGPQCYLKDVAQIDTIAVSGTDTTKIVFWVVEKGYDLNYLEDDDGFLNGNTTAPALRMGLPFGDLSFKHITPVGATLFLNAIKYGTGNSFEDSVVIANFAITKDSVNLLTGERYKVPAYVYPSDAKAKTVLYSSKDSTIAHVFDNGHVVGLTAGTTTIYGEAENGQLDSLVVTVEVSDKPVVAFYLSNAERLNPSDAVAIEIMRNAGYIVNPITAEKNPADTLGADLVLISSSLSSGKVRDDLGYIGMPVLNWENGAHDDFGLSTDQNAKPAEGITITDNSHAITTGLPTGLVKLQYNPGNVTFGKIYEAQSNSAISLAKVFEPTLLEYDAWFLYEKGDSLVPEKSDEPGYPANGLSVNVRIGLPFENTTFSSCTPEAVTILLNSLDYALDGNISTGRPAVYLAFQSDTVDVEVDETNAIREVAMLCPSNHTSTGITITYTSADPSIASITEDGQVTGNSVGLYTTIYAEAGGLRDSIVARVVGSITDETSITVSPDTMKLAVNEEGQLFAAVLPLDATFPEYTWTIADNNIATITPGGLVIGKAEGITEAYATTDYSGLVDTAIIEVTFVHITELTVSPDIVTLALGESMSFELIIKPENASDKSVTWSSSNPTAIPVSRFGAITVLEVDTATITVTANENGVVGTATVNATGTNLTTLKSNKTKIYPNPASDLLNIDFRETGNGYIKVSDLSGRLKISKVFHQGKDVLINTGKLTPGVYIIELNNNNLSEFKRIVIE